jgi:hypothetical protein
MRAVKIALALFLVVCHVHAEIQSCSVIDYVGSTNW